MNLLGSLLDAQGSPALKQLTTAFGVSEDDARNALSALVPTLARGMQNNLAQRNGLEDLLGALAKGQHQRHLDQPDAVPAWQVTSDGNAILGICSAARMSAAAWLAMPRHGPDWTAIC